MNDETQPLLQFIKENPDLPIMPMVYIADRHFKKAIIVNIDLPEE